MKKIITILLLCSFCLSDKLDYYSLTEEQREVANKIYNIAVKENLAESMIAISWQESRLGKIPINLEDKASCGVHHVHINTFLWQNKIKNTITNRNIYCMELIKSVELSTKNAMQFFLYAKKKHNGNHNKAIMSYNAGFNLENNSKAITYLTSVRKWILDAKEVVKTIETINELKNKIELLSGECDDFIF